MTLGEKIKDFRKKNNYTQEELASKCGVSRRSIIDWENDKYHPQSDMLISLANVFNIDINELISNDSSVAVNNEDIKGNFVCMNINKYKEEEKRLKGKYKKYNQFWIISFALILALFISLIISIILKDLELYILTFVIFIVDIIVITNLRSKYNYFNRMRIYNYIVNNNENRLCLTPYLEISAEINNRLIIRYIDDIIVNIDISKILNIELYRNSELMNEYYPNDVDFYSTIYGMIINYDDGSSSKISFFISIKDKQEAVAVRKTMAQQFNKLKQRIKK